MRESGCTFHNQFLRELLSHRNGSTCKLSYSDNKHTLNFQGIIQPQRVIAFLLCRTCGLKDHKVPLSCTQFHTRYLQDKLLGKGRSSKGLCRFSINHLSRQANPYIYHPVGKRIFIIYNLHTCLNILFECPSVMSLSVLWTHYVMLFYVMLCNVTSGSYIWDKVLYASIRQIQYNNILWLV